MQCIVDKLQTISGLAVCLAGLVYHGAVFAKAAQRGDVTTLHRARCIIYLVTSTPAVALLVLIIIDDTELSTYIVLNILRIGNALCTSAASAEVCWKLSRNITPFQRIANDLIGLAAFAQMVILGFGFWQYATKGSQWLWIAVAPQTMVLLFVTLHLSHYSAGEHENSGNATENDDVRRSTAIQITSRRRARVGSGLMLFSFVLAATEASFQANQVLFLHDVQYFCHSMLSLTATILLQWRLNTSERASDQNPVIEQAQLGIDQSSWNQSTDSIVRAFGPALGRSDYELRSLASTLRTTSSDRSLVPRDTLQEVASCPR